MGAIWSQLLYIFLLDEADDDNDGDGSNNYNNRSLAPIMGQSDKL